MGALDTIRMLGEDARRRREYEKVRDNQIAQMAQAMHVPLVHGLDFGGGDRTIVVCVSPGEKVMRPARIRYADQNGVEHTTDWGAMTVPAGATIRYIELKPDAV